ncbi:MAG TPA: hypothetical protein PKN54_00775 [Candidatus Cloacimonas acidaminovorans]|nr:hypothetical protein [Candidatus Cloacimonas acidaminovorans]
MDDIKVGSFVIVKRPETKEERRKSPVWRDYIMKDIVGKPVKVIGYYYNTKGHRILEIEKISTNIILGDYIWIRESWCKKIGNRERCIKDFIKTI